MLKSVQHNPGVFSVNTDKLRPLEKWIMKIEGQILDGLIFDVRNQTCFAKFWFKSEAVLMPGSHKRSFSVIVVFFLHV